MYFKTKIMKLIRNSAYILLLLIPSLSATAANGIITIEGKAVWTQYQDMLQMNAAVKKAQADAAALQNAGQPVDWAGIASSLGMAEGLTPFEVNLRLSQLNEYSSNWIKELEDTAKVKYGVSVDNYLLSSELDPKEFADQMAHYDKGWQDVKYIKTAPPAPKTTKDSSAGTSIDVSNMLDQIRKQIPQLIRFVVALSYVCGIFLMVAGVMKLKAYGQQTVMSSSHASFGPCMTYIAVGTALTFFPSLLNMATATFMGIGGGDAIYSYTGSSSGFGFAGLTSVLIGIIKLVGFIAFFKGWMILSKLGSHNGGQGVVGKGVVHILAGVFAVNIMTTWEVLRASFGYMW